MAKYKKNFENKKKKRIDLIQLSNEKIDYYNVTTQYIKWYNREINQIFNDIQRVTPRLHSSNVHINSSYKFQNQKEEEDNECIEIGTFWSALEKRKFFKFLSRYSIHRLDEWYPLFKGSKSKEEILIYYKVLQKNLKIMKEKNPNTLIGYDEYPIAYEINDNFIEFEEHMSRRLIERERLPYFSEEPETIDINGDDDDGLINLKRWGSKWRTFYSKSLIQEEVDTSKPELINNEEDYKELYELNQEFGDFKGNKYVISQYEPVDNMKLNDRSMVKMPKVAIPFSNDAMIYLTQCVKDHIREIIYKCVLPNINDRSIHGNKIQKIYQITKKTNLPRMLRRKYKNHKLGEINGSNDLIIKHSKDKVPYPHIITKEEINNGLMMMKRDGMIVKNKSLSLIETLNKFEIGYEDDLAFKERVFLQSLLPEIIYDKLNHSIPIVNNQKSYESINKIDRILQEPIDQELKMVCGLFPRDYKINLENNQNFNIINDNERYFGYNNINTILNYRLDNELELKLIEKETERLDKEDMIKSSQYMDTIYHYFGTILNFNQPGVTVTKRRGQEILSGPHVIVEREVITEDNNEELPVLWPSVLKVFDKVNC